MYQVEDIQMSNIKLYDSKLTVVELSGKDQRIALDKHSRLVVRFLVLGQYLAKFLGVNGQIFAKSAIFQLCSSIFQKL